MGATLLCICCTGHSEDRLAVPADALTFRVFNYAGVNAGALRTASEEAAALFLRAGVPTVWNPCRTNREGSDEPVCKSTHDPTVLTMRILAAALPMSNLRSHSIFGFAFPRGRSGFASMACVFWDRVQELAESKNVNAARLLAVILVHEAGHLLLGENSHYPAGVMKAVWDGKEVYQASRNSLSFWPAQQDALRDAVRGRMRSARDRRNRIELASSDAGQ